MSDNKMPSWPEETADIRLHVGCAFPNIGERHYRALAAAWEARCRLAVEALNDLYPALALDLRWNEDDDEDTLASSRPLAKVEKPTRRVVLELLGRHKDALVSRVRGVEEALAAIGPLPDLSAERQEQL